MYRQIQEIRPGMWDAQYELERKTDEVEGGAGHPLPDRYRVLSAGGLNSQLRVHQRVYPSIAEWGRLVEVWASHEQMQALEVERKQFYTWEREEMLWVDQLGSPPMRWVTMMDEDERRRQTYPRTVLARTLSNLG